MKNPIIQRELVGLLRTKRALALQVLLIIILGSLVVLRWPSEARADFSGTQALQVMQLFGYGLMVGLILLVPVFPATTVVREKQQRTLALLLNSPMNPWAIFFGKLIGVVGFVLLLLLLSLPAAAACYAMGGVSGQQIVQTYCVLSLLAVQYAVLGLLISSYAATSDSALRMTYGAILFLSVITLGPKQFLQGLVAGPTAELIEWIRCISPIPAMMKVMQHSGFGSEGITSESDPVVRFAIVAIVSSVLMAVWTASRFSMKMFDKARSQGKITDEQSAQVQLIRRIMFLWFFDPKRRGKLIGMNYGQLVMAAIGAVVFGYLSFYIFTNFPLILQYIMPGATCAFLAVMCLASVVWQLASMNPIAVKEQKCRKFGRAHWIIRLFGACLIISMGLMYVTTNSTMDWGVETLAAIVVLLQIALIVLVTPSLASGLISAEVESGSWQLLQMTPIRAPTIILGKLVSAGLTLLMILMATMPTYAVLIFIDSNQAEPITMTLIGLALTAGFALIFTAAVSSMFRQTAAATTAAYCGLVGLCAGTMLFWLGEDAPFTHATVETVLKINPLAATLTLIEAPGFRTYNLVPTNWYFLAGASAVCLLILVVRTWQLSRPR